MNRKLAVVTCLLFVSCAAFVLSLSLSSFAQVEKLAVKPQTAPKTGSIQATVYYNGSDAKPSTTYPKTFMVTVLHSGEVVAGGAVKNSYFAESDVPVETKRSITFDDLPIRGGYEIHFDDPSGVCKSVIQKIGITTATKPVQCSCNMGAGQGTVLVGTKYNSIEIEERLDKLLTKLEQKAN